MTLGAACSTVGQTSLVDAMIGSDAFGSDGDSNTVLDGPNADQQVGDVQTEDTQAPACGNRRIESGETCDDGNRVNGDGCSDRCAIEVPAQWVERTPPLSPRRRQGHVMSFDPILRESMVFGGYPLDQQTRTTWTWNGTVWTMKTPVTQPEARYGARAVFDEARSITMMFGGSRPEAETWSWDGTEWRQLQPLNSPPNRKYFAMTYDAAREEIVLFGGQGDSGQNLGDTWVWNGRNWTQRFPSVSPSPRWVTTMAYDDARQESILFGGEDTSGYLRDTWAWNGENWQQKFPANAPSLRGDHLMAYHQHRAQVLLFGGTAPNTSNMRDDTWTWDGNIWTLHTQASDEPLQRASSAAVYDNVRREIVMFGGFGDDSNQNDTWVFR